MRSLKQYITESVHTYDYTIKIAGDVDKKWLDMFKFNLNKFDPIEISDPTSTPIQKSPYGFPGLTNQSITIIKAKFRYPATEPMIHQMVKLLGKDPNHVRMIGSAFNDSIDAEVQEYETQADNSPVLTSEFSDEKGAKEANSSYSGSYLKDIHNQIKDSKIEMPFAGTKTKNSYDPFKPDLDNDPKGKNSPMSKITRPAKPSTGASR